MDMGASFGRRHGPDRATLQPETPEPAGIGTDETLPALAPLLRQLLATAQFDVSQETRLGAVRLAARVQQAR
jgi:hypothetical protein